MPSEPVWEDISTALAALLSKLPADIPADYPLPRAKVLIRLRADIGAVIERLSALKQGLDPVQQPATFFDPTNPEIVGRLIAQTLLQQPRVNLTALRSFYGSGVYALYYRGNFPAYAPARGTETPLYVGKADPADTNAANPQQQGRTLSLRLGDHLKSITAAENLQADEFDARYLVVKSAWQGTAELYLIEHFKPIWNSEVKICYGFGKHGDSPLTRKNTRSPWDTLHPGRHWAGEGNISYPLTSEQITEAVLKHYAANPPLS